MPGEVGVLMPVSDSTVWKLPVLVEPSVAVLYMSTDDLLETELESEGLERWRPLRARESLPTGLGDLYVHDSG